MKLALAPVLPQAAPEGDIQYHEIAEAEHERFGIDAAGRIRFEGVLAVGQMIRGADLLHPEVRVAVPDGVGAGARSRLQRRLLAWVRDLVEELLAPLRHERHEALSGAGRGLVYQIEQGLGTTTTRQARAEIDSLAVGDRRLLAASGIVLGVRHVYQRWLVKPRPVEQRVAICRAFLGSADLVPEPSAAAVSLPVAPRVEGRTCLSIGFPLLGERAVRVDFIERIDARLRALARAGPFVLPPEIASWLGCSAEELEPVVEALGYQRDRDGSYVRRRSATRKRASSRRRSSGDR
jgi:ATP-dependent RNA helicase SUPV3L1/SUV3